MARPIPVNQAGLCGGRTLDAQVHAPAWDMPQPVPAAVRAAPRPAAEPPRPAAPSWRATGILLLAASFLTGSLAIVCGLGIWPPLSLSGAGLDEEVTFLTSVGGIYLLAATLYAAWRTRLLRDLAQAPWDARLMAFTSMGIGGATGVTAGVVALAIAALFMIGIAALALLLSSSEGGPQG